MDNQRTARLGSVVLAGLCLWQVPSFVNASWEPPACPSGMMSARLTGWHLNEKLPRGTADFNLATKQLEVAVTNVALPDGTVLNVLDGDDRIGSLPPLKRGGASVNITANTLKEDSRIRILHDDRPIVSANLKCDAVEPSPTVTPSPVPLPTLSPSPSPTVMPSPTPAPSPTLKP